jgi:hypothetical protein
LIEIGSNAANLPAQFFHDINVSVWSGVRAGLTRANVGRSIIAANRALNPSALPSVHAHIARQNAKQETLAMPDDMRDLSSLRERLAAVMMEMMSEGEPRVISGALIIACVVGATLV